MIPPWVEEFDRVPPVRALGGVTPNGDEWSLHYGAVDSRGTRHWVALVENGCVLQGGAGWDIPELTEIGFASGLKEGRGNYYLYGLVADRILRVRAEGPEEGLHSEVATVPFPAATADDGEPLRAFGLVRPPVDDVVALVGFDADGSVVQRIVL